LARRPKQLNHRLDAFLFEANMSHKGLAGRVVALGAARGQDLQYNHSSVARWLRGETPRQPTPALIGEVFSAELGRTVTVADIGMAQREKLPDDAALQLSQRPADSARLLQALAHDDLERRRALLDAGFDVVAFSSAALRWIVAPRTALPAANGSRAIGAADIEDIEEATRAFRVLDNRMGGGRIRPTVVDYLHGNIVPLLHNSRCTEEVRRSLFSAAAELTQLAGWQAYDLEQQGLAQRYLVQALSMARFAGDESLGGEIVAAMSHQAIWVSQLDQAIDMAQAAQASAHRVGLPVLETEGLVMEAHAYALLGDAGACSRALKRASVSFERGGSEPPAWLRYFDHAYLAARIAHCFRALGQGDATEKYALRSLDMDERFIRGKAFNIALLAAGYAAQGEVEQACATGRDAVDRIVALDSARAVTYIRNLLVDLRGHDDVGEYRDFKAYAQARLPGLRRRASRR
jgi:tetratricopeptide (TPR) repeat protein